jgi:23S rRNA (cytosine1962-C5)-methyltransferase
MAGLIIAPRARIFHGHDWVYATEVKKAFGDPQPGDVITLKDFRDRPLGTAIYNPLSQIVARRFSRRRQDLDLEFFTRRIQQAMAYRDTLPLDPALCRLVWSESDGIPGLIVDRYGDHLVMQTLTLAMDQRKDLIRQALYPASALKQQPRVDVQPLTQRAAILCRRRRGGGRRGRATSACWH